MKANQIIHKVNDDFFEDTFQMYEDDAFDMVSDMKYNNYPVSPIHCNEEETPVDFSATEYFPPDVFKPFLANLWRRMSEDDARELLQAVLNELSKPDSSIRMSKSIESAIIQIMIDKQ